MYGTTCVTTNEKTDMKPAIMEPISRRLESIWCLMCGMSYLDLELGV